MADGILCTCLTCGKALATIAGRSSKYCSVTCYRAAQRSGNYKRGHGPEFPRAPCHFCGVITARYPSKRRNGANSDRVFCSRTCYDKSRAECRTACAHCGSRVPLAVAKFCSWNCRVAAKRPTPCKCKNCGVAFTAITWRGDQMIAFSSAKVCSPTCRNEWIRRDPDRKRKIGEAFRGDKHHNWQGGKSQLNNVSNRGPNWASQRAAALKRDGYRCLDCGMAQEECRASYGRGLDVDHVVPYHNFSSYIEANNLSNLESRCASCHRKAEAKRTMVQMVLPLQDSLSRRHKGYVCGERVNTAKLTPESVMDIRRRVRLGETYSMLAKEFGVGKGAVSMAANGKTWGHLPMAA